jgi:hypothetical protein
LNPSAPSSCIIQVEIGAPTAIESGIDSMNLEIMRAWYR